MGSNFALITVRFQFPFLCLDDGNRKEREGGSPGLTTWGSGFGRGGRDIVGIWFGEELSGRVV